jgi:hypothetical protein
MPQRRKRDSNPQKLTTPITEKLRKPTLEVSTPSSPSLEKRRSTQKTSTSQPQRASTRLPQKQWRNKSSDKNLADIITKT